MNNAQLKAWILSVKAEGIDIATWVRASFGDSKRPNFIYNFLKKPDAGMRHENVIALQKGLEKLRGDAPLPQGGTKTSGGLGDTGYSGKRRKIFEMLDQWENMTAREQDEFLAIALMHKKGDSDDPHAVSYGHTEPQADVRKKR